MADTTDARTRTDEPRRGGMLRETRDSFAGSAIGDWAYTTAVAVWAYGQGGAKALGVWMAIRATLMTGSTPFGARPCIATTGLLSVRRLIAGGCPDGRCVSG